MDEETIAGKLISMESGVVVFFLALLDATPIRVHWCPFVVSCCVVPMNALRLSDDSDSTIHPLL